MSRIRPLSSAFLVLSLLPGAISAQRPLLGSALQPSSASVSVPREARHTSDPLERFTGRYALDTAASEPVPAAIERTVAPMNMIVRSVARRRLSRLNQPSPRLEISVSGDVVEFRYPGQPAVRLPRANTMTDWRNTEGEAMRVQLLASDPSAEPTLREQYDTKDGRRINEYRVDQAEGRLRMRVTVTGPRLTIPLTYTLAYRRE